MTARPVGADELDALRTPTPIAARSEVERHALATVARRIAALRRHRDALVGRLGEGAWELLLDVYALALDAGRAPVADLCHDRWHPLATTLRTIAALEEDGKLVRTVDGDGGLAVALTPAAAATIETFLEDAGDAMR